MTNLITSPFTSDIDPKHACPGCLARVTAIEPCCETCFAGIPERLQKEVAYTAGRDTTAAREAHWAAVGWLYRHPPSLPSLEARGMTRLTAGRIVAQRAAQTAEAS